MMSMGYDWEKDWLRGEQSKNRQVIAELEAALAAEKKKTAALEQEVSSLQKLLADMATCAMVNNSR